MQKQLIHEPRKRNNMLRSWIVYATLNLNYYVILKELVIVNSTSFHNTACVYTLAIYGVVGVFKWYINI